MINRLIPAYWLSKFEINTDDYRLRFIQALLLFLPTVFICSNRYFLGFIVFSLLLYEWRLDRKDWIFFLYALFVAANTSLGLLTGEVAEFNILWSNGIIGGMLLLLAYLAARTITPTTLKYLLAFICLEAVCVLIQGWMGIRVFFYDQLKDFEGMQYYAPYKDQADYFYTPLQCIRGLFELKPFGLTNNSLVMAVKLLVGVVLLSVVPLKHGTRIVLYALLASAMVVVRGRATLGALLCFTVLWIVYELTYGHKRRAILSFVAAAASVFLLISMVLTFCPQEMIMKINESETKEKRQEDDLLAKSVLLGEDSAPITQHRLASAPVIKFHKLTNYKDIYTSDGSTSANQAESEASRTSFLESNSNKIIFSLSGRENIWKAAIAEIQERPWLGTYSIRVPVLSGTYTNNAYLGLLHVHGLIGALLLVGFYTRRISEYKPRFWLVLPFFIVSLTDDTLFWYMSLQDIVVLYILTIYREKIFPRPKIDLANPP